MRDTMRNISWALRHAERDERRWTEQDSVPRASEVIYEFGRMLAVALLLALIVNFCLSEAGVPGP